jgi:Holliday junction resolvasome RuvABC DNA-binding subunit
MVLELKDKVGISGDENDISLRDEIDAIEALKALGYNPKDARDALRDVDKTITKTGDRIKAALKILGK